MSLIHNERTKLTAAALDRASTASLAVGALGPFAAMLYGPSGTADHIRSIVVLFGALAWFAAAVVRHLLARHHLGRLQ